MKVGLVHERRYYVVQTYPIIFMLCAKTKFDPSLSTHIIYTKRLTQGTVVKKSQACVVFRDFDSCRYFKRFFRFRTPIEIFRISVSHCLPSS